VNTPAVEVEPDFYLRINWNGNLSTRQIAVLRRVGPGFSDTPPQSLLELWRQAQEVTLGPYCRKYQAERAKSELHDVGLVVEVLAI
jgi:hypothetical protein